MGEVYRARDERLERDVAVKVLPAAVSRDPERLRRFEQEAQTPPARSTIRTSPRSTTSAATTARPVHRARSCSRARRCGRGSAGGAPARPQGRSTIATQIARGLAAAHEKGHRPPRPQAREPLRHQGRPGQDPRLRPREADASSTTRTATPQPNLPTADGTEPGVVLGTLGLHVARAGARASPPTHRSDIFAFGAVLYEMLSGARAFHRDTAAETMSAILREEPPDLSATNKDVPPGLERVVRHCLEKNPEERFHSAHDLAFDLQALSGSTPARGRRAGDGRRDVAAASGAAPRRRARARGDGGDVLPRPRHGEGRSAYVPPAHVPPRHDLRGALRTGRPDGRLLRRLGRRPHGDLRGPSREPGVAAVRPRRRGGPRDLANGRHGRVARPEIREWVPAPGNARTDLRRGGRGATRDPRTGGMGGLGARRQGPRGLSPRSRKEPNRVPGRQDRLRDERMGQSPARVARRRARGLRRPSHARGRRRVDRRGRPLREEADGLAVVCNGAGAGVGRRRADLVHGDGGRGQPRSLRDHPFGEGGAPRRGAGVPHAPGHLAGRPHAGHARHASFGDGRPGSRRDEGTRHDLARLDARRRHRRRRPDDPLLRDRGGRRRRVLRLHPEDGRLAGRKAGRRRSPGPVAGRGVGAGHPAHVLRSAPRRVSDPGGRDEGLQDRRPQGFRSRGGFRTERAFSSRRPNRAAARASSGSMWRAASPGP